MVCTKQDSAFLLMDSIRNSDRVNKYIDLLEIYVNIYIDEVALCDYIYVDSVVIQNLGVSP